jgi:hypothetical protein
VIFFVILEAQRLNTSDCVITKKITFFAFICDLATPTFSQNSMTHDALLLHSWIDV